MHEVFFAGQEALLATFASSSIAALAVQGAPELGSDPVAGPDPDASRRG